MKNFISKSLCAGALLFFLVSSACGQFSTEYSVPDRVPSNTPVLITVVTEAKFISIRARKTLFDTANVYELDAGLRARVLDSNDLKSLKESISGTERLFIFSGSDGDYLVEITYFDPKMGIKVEAAKVRIGELQPSPTPTPTPTPGPTPTPSPAPSNSIEAALQKIPQSLRNKTTRVRQPDGNYINQKVVYSLGQAYGSIAREAKSNPDAWSTTTMSREIRVRVALPLASNDIRSWSPFFSVVESEQNKLTNDIEAWAGFYLQVEELLSSQ